MKTIIGILVAIGAVSFSGIALGATTNSGYLACQTEEWLDDAISFAVAEDLKSLQAYIDATKCIPLRSGVQVTVTGCGGVLCSKTEFAYEGVKFWTPTEAINK